jgi:hypothetical protein
MFACVYECKQTLFKWKYSITNHLLFGKLSYCSLLWYCYMFQLFFTIISVSMQYCNLR